MVFLWAGNFPGLSHPLKAEQNWSRKRWGTCAAQRGWGTKVLGADSQMLQCPWMLFMLLGFLMFQCHLQLLLLPAEEI